MVFQCSAFEQTAKVVRSKVVQSKLKFTGHFSCNCQNKSVSQTLLSLMHMVTGSSYTGPTEVNADNEPEHYEPALSIVQLVSFNIIQKRGGSNSQFCHNAEKETPLSIYIAFLLHSHTRSHTLVDKFHHLGLCISYDHMSTLATNLGNSICAQFVEDWIVCPASLCFNIFSMFAVDNTDHNPTISFIIL